MEMNDNQNIGDQQSELTDKVGIFISALCCIHCMAIPFLIIFAPAIGEYFQNELVHVVAIALVVPVGLYSFISKLKVHQNKLPLYFGILGMVSLVIGHIFHEVSGHDHSHDAEIIASIIGGIALIFAHIYNLKLCRCKTCKH